MIDSALKTETVLLSDAQNGDRAAFGELVTLHYDGVIRVVYRLCGDVQLAQDAAQECFIRAWIKIAAYQPRSPFRNWLYRIAVNTALDLLRKKTEESLDEDARFKNSRDEQDGPESQLIAKEEKDMMQAAIRALPEAARCVLVLREYSELTYDEIASVLDIPIGTVMSRLNYARTRLREILNISWRNGG